MEKDKEKSFETVIDNGILKLHTYVAHFSTGDKTIKLPYGKTSLISAILFGSVTEFRELIKEYIQPESITINVAELKRKIIMKALDILDRDFSVKILDQVNDVMNIVLTEYDADGKVIKEGNCFNLPPEDIKVLVDILIYDIPEVLKNVFGVGVTKQSLPPIKRGRKPKETEIEESQSQ